MVDRLGGFGWLMTETSSKFLWMLWCLLLLRLLQ